MEVLDAGVDVVGNMVAEEELPVTDLLGRQTDRFAILRPDDVYLCGLVETEFSLPFPQA